MNNIYKIIVLALFSYSAYTSDQCSLVKFEYIKKKKKVSSKAHLCLKIKDEAPLVYSKSCSSGNCEAVKSLKDFDKKRKLHLKPGVGSPHFGKCHILKGFPVNVKMHKYITDKKTMFCIFSDKSILNTDALYRWFDK